MACPSAVRHPFSLWATWAKLVSGPAMTTSSERRVATRRPAHLVAEIETGGERLGCGVSRDASASGMLLLARTDLSAGTRVLLRVWVPGEDEPRELDGEVVRRETMRPGDSPIWKYKIAVSLDAPPVDLETIIDSLAGSTEDRGD